MEKYRVLGFQKQDYDFTDQRSGRQVQTSGYRLYLYQPKDGVQGYATESLYFSNDKLINSGIDDLNNLLDKEVMITFNRYAKPATIQILDVK